MTTENQVLDPMDAAMDAEAPSRPRVVFGEMQVDVWFCTLQKGVGKTPFDPTNDSPDSRRTAIDFCLIPLRGDYNIKRGLIAESNEWAKIVKPSLRELGTDLRAINGKFVKAEMVATGRKYTDANSGEEKINTTFKFLTVFDSPEACQAAADDFFNNHETAAAPATTPAAVAAPTATSDKERETALRFLPALWTAAGKDVTKFAEKIAGNPLTSKYFTIESQEVLTIIGS